MGTLRFDLDVTLPRATAFDLLDRHYRGLGYRVEESDRMNFRLVMDRGWLLGALLGGPVKKRSVWLRATVQELDPERSVIKVVYDGYRKAVDARAKARYAEEVRAFEETCRAEPHPVNAGGTGGEAMVREVVIKEVVRIPCQYCGSLVDNTATKCSDCGAPRP